MRLSLGDTPLYYCWPTAILLLLMATHHVKSVAMHVIPKALLTSHRTCTYVLVTEKNRLICKAHLSYPCNFITEFQRRTDPTMKIDMHLFSACTQYGHKHIHFSRVTNERLVHVYFPCKCCKISPFTCLFCTCRIIHSRVPSIHISVLNKPFLVGPGR